MAKSTTKTTTPRKRAAKKTAAAPKLPEPKSDGTELTTPPEQPNPEAALQHPSLADEAKPGVEVAERSADVEKASSDVHRKAFVLLRAAYEAQDGDARKGLHLANVEATRQAMIGQGLRPSADGKFVKSEQHPDGRSITLFYDVPAVPAVVAGEEGETVAHAHVTLDDQHAAEKASS